MYHKRISNKQIQVTKPWYHGNIQWRHHLAGALNFGSSWCNWKCNCNKKFCKHRFTIPCKWSFVFIWKAALFMKSGTLHAFWCFSYEKRCFSSFSVFYTFPYFLVLSQIGLAVSLIERGGVCTHWWPDLALFSNHF